MELLDQSEETTEISKALSECQLVFEKLKKKASADVPGRPWKYADYEEVVEIIKVPFHTHGLCYSHRYSIFDGKDIMVTALNHISGQWFKSFSFVEPEIKYNKDGKASMSNSQAFKSASTQLKRVHLIGMAGLPEEDDDGENAKRSNRNASDSNSQHPDTPLIRDVARQLRELCQEHHIDTGEFAEFHRITRGDHHKISLAVKCFDDFREKFLKRIPVDPQKAN